MSQITILGKDKTIRIIKTSSTDNVGVGQAIEGSNYLISVAGDRMLTPSPKLSVKERMTFIERKDLKDAKKSWKLSVLKTYPEESGSASQIIKRHFAKKLN